jgi:hypothetical protein
LKKISNELKLFFFAVGLFLFLLRMSSLLRELVDFGVELLLQKEESIVYSQAVIATILGLSFMTWLPIRMSVRLQ